MIEQYTYSSPGVMSERRVSTYNDNGWLTVQDIYNSAGSKTQQISYTQFDAVGNVLTWVVNVIGSYTNTYTKEYAKYDSYKESKHKGGSSYFQSGYTDLFYDVNGNLNKLVDAQNSAKNRVYISDLSGHFLQKTENSKTQNYFYANGNPVGSSGAWGAADFDYNYTPVSDQYPATTPGSYVVSAGDTLQGIAMAVYGDAKLWYLIADANGLAGDAGLVVGTSLTIPNKITNLHNDYKTFKPYAPGSIIGDTTPTLPDPPPPPQPSSSGGGGGGCGGLGQIVMIVVAIAVAWVVGPAAFSFFGGAGGGLGAVIGAGAVAGAAASIASQAVGIAIGAQDKFSWKGVALAALGGAVTAGVTGYVPGVEATGVTSLGAKLAPDSLFAQGLINGAVGSVITQGVGVVTGLQDKFSWRAVAASALSSGVGAALPGGGGPAGDFARRLVTGTVYQAIANKGKVNFAGVAADAFGNAIGDEIVGQMFKSEQAERLAQARNAVMEAAAPAAPEGAGYLGGIKLKDSWRFAPGLDSTANADYSAGYWGKQSYSLTGSGATGDLYTTQKGDSLARIAGEKLGDETLWPLIARANGIPIEKAGMLPLGKEIVIPPKDGANLDSARAMAGAYSKWDAANKQALAAQAATKSAQGLNDYLFGYSDSKANPNLVCGPDWTLEKNYARVAMPESSGQKARHSIGVWDPAQTKIAEERRQQFRDSFGSIAGSGLGALSYLGTYAATGDYDLAEKNAIRGFQAGQLIEAGVAAKGVLGRQSVSVANRATRAEAAQISSGYKADVWSSQTLSKGDIVIGMRGKEPNIGQSAFYTNVDALRASNMNFQTMGELTQVAPNPRFGLRQEFGVYQVQPSSVEVATGRALANTYAPNGTFIGNGGATQYFIPTYKTDLQHLYTIRVLND